MIKARGVEKVEVGLTELNLSQITEMDAPYVETGVTGRISVLTREQTETDLLMAREEGRFKAEVMVREEDELCRQMGRSTVTS